MKKFLLTLTLAFALLSSAAIAQQTSVSLSGAYIFSEEGSGVSQPIASIAILNFMSGGTVAGMEISRSPGTTAKNSLQGTYVLATDGTGSLALTAQTMPTDGSDPVVSNVNYQLISPRSGPIDAIRTDNGFFTIGHLSLAAPASPLKGSFVFAEHGNGTPFAGLGELNLDGNNALSGFERVETVGFNVVNKVTGNYSVGSDGFGSFTLNIPSTDINGNVSNSAANYVFVSAVDQVYAIRTDANTAAVSTLSALLP